MLPSRVNLQSLRMNTVQNQCSRTGVSLNQRFPINNEEAFMRFDATILALLLVVTPILAQAPPAPARMQVTMAQAAGQALVDDSPSHAAFYSGRHPAQVPGERPLLHSRLRHLHGLAGRDRFHHGRHGHQHPLRVPSLRPAGRRDLLRREHPHGRWGDPGGSAKGLGPDGETGPSRLRATWASTRPFTWESP